MLNFIIFIIIFELPLVFILDQVLVSNLSNICKKIHLQKKFN